MASVTHSFMKLFRGTPTDTVPGNRPLSAATRLTRRSSGLGEVSRMFPSEEPLCVLDIGSTSASNIRYMTERGHKIYSEDLLDASTDPSLKMKDETGQVVMDSKRFLSDNLVYPAAHFDVVLCWNLADYMDESLVKPVVARLWSTIKPGGQLLAFFHTREAGPDAPCYRYHIMGSVMCWRCSTSKLVEDMRQRAPPWEPFTRPSTKVSACNESSTIATSKTCSATLPRSSFSSPVTISEKCW